MKKIALTMGDPGGVGPEIIIKALASEETWLYCRPILIGDLRVIEEALRLLDLPLRPEVIDAPRQSPPPRGTIELIDMGEGQEYEKGKTTQKGGRLSASCVRKAVELALKKEVDGMVTAPISKEAWRMAGIKWGGHTEMVAELTGTSNFAMMLVGGPLRVILVTIHTPLRCVPGMIVKESVLRTIRLAKRAAEMLSLQAPSIAVAGLNPHAGEAGMFGDEEIKEIIPAVEEARKEGIPVTGPFPPDTIFHKAYKGEIDIVVSLYHDQGLIPLKMISFDTGVNMTVGLPIVRTSPDHGTAYDIAWQGKANPTSMIEAIKLASTLSI